MTATVSDAIARVPQWAGKGARVEPLGGGITNLNYRVDVGGESFVLRISGDATDLLGVNRKSEQIASRAASDLGIAPEVVFIIQPEGYLITRLIECCPLPPEQMMQPENIRRVAQALRKFHQSPLRLPSTFSPFRRVEHLARVAREHHAQLPRNFDWFAEKMGQVEAAFLHDPFVPCPCHDDLLNGNFFLREAASGEPEVLIIDWEYAGMGDPFFDLANFSSHHQLDDRQVEFKLACYFGTFTPRQLARLQLMRPMSEIHEAMWGTVQTRLSKLDFNFGEYADLWFGRAARTMQDPRWGNWLKEMTHA